MMKQDKPSGTKILKLMAATFVLLVVIICSIALIIPGHRSSLSAGPANHTSTDAHHSQSQVLH